VAGLSGIETVEASAEMPAEISNSIASVFKTYSGQRPAEVTTTIRDTRVSCVLKDAVQGFDDAIKLAGTEEIEKDVRRLTMATFRRDAIEAVTRITHRRVLAFISDHDAKTGVATEVFIVESPPRRPRSIFLDRQND
jgi:uncharacterized protein YbcI